MNITQLIESAIHASLLAGVKIREVYSSVDFKIELKEDLSPLTKADRSAHEVILKELEITGLPVLSEEGEPISFAERKDWDLFWLVDPLDGTKEFIKRNDEFTVNIALISKKQPVAGIIYAPITGELYVGIPGIGAWKLLNPSDPCTLESIQRSGIKLQEEIKLGEFTVAVSRSHINPETEAYIEKLRMKHETLKLVNRGSSLKICMVAEGTAQVYPRYGKTMEWDTAAGHALVKAVGRNIFQPDLKTELIYNKESLFNPHFIVL